MRATDTRWCTCPYRGKQNVRRSAFAVRRSAFGVRGRSQDIGNTYGSGSRSYYFRFQCTAAERRTVNGNGERRTGTVNAER